MYMSNAYQNSYRTRTTCYTDNTRYPLFSTKSCENPVLHSTVYTIQYDLIIHSIKNSINRSKLQSRIWHVTELLSDQHVRPNVRPTQTNMSRTFRSQWTNDCHSVGAFSNILERRDLLAVHSIGSNRREGRWGSLLPLASLVQTQIPPCNTLRTKIYRPRYKVPFLAVVSKCCWIRHLLCILRVLFLELLHHNA